MWPSLPCISVAFVVNCMQVGEVSRNGTTRSWPHGRMGPPSLRHMALIAFLFCISPVILLALYWEMQGWLRLRLRLKLKRWILQWCAPSWGKKGNPFCKKKKKKKGTFTGTFSVEVTCLIFCAVVGTLEKHWWFEDTQENPKPPFPIRQL